MPQDPITKAATAFLDALGTHATDPAVFLTLNSLALDRGLFISAEQHGIRGTTLTFRKVEKI